MQRTCRHKIEKTTCKRRCCRGRRGVLEAIGEEEPRTLGPWQSCPLPGPRLLGRPLSQCAPPLAAVRSGEAPSPFWLLSLGLSLPRTLPDPNSSSKPRIPALSGGPGLQILHWGKATPDLMSFVGAPSLTPTRTQSRSLLSPAFSHHHLP